MQIHILKKIVISLLLIVGGFLAWFIWLIVTDKPPSFFPLNNSSAEYTVSKKCSHGQGWNEDDETQDKGFCIEYKGNNVFMNDSSGNTNFFRITVGKSKIDLEPFVGKEVKNVKGNFVTSNKQCINNRCIDIGGAYVVLDISELELAE